MCLLVVANMFVLRWKRLQWCLRSLVRVCACLYMLAIVCKFTFLVMLVWICLCCLFVRAFRLYARACLSWLVLASGGLCFTMLVCVYLCQHMIACACWLLELACVLQLRCAMLCLLVLDQPCLSSLDLGCICLYVLACACPNLLVHVLSRLCFRSLVLTWALLCLLACSCPRLVVFACVWFLLLGFGLVLMVVLVFVHRLVIVQACIWLWSLMIVSVCWWCFWMLMLACAIVSVERACDCL